MLIFFFFFFEKGICPSSPHKMLIKAQWFTMENLIHIRLVIKNKTKKKKLCSPKFRTMKPFRDRNSGVKVLAIASVFRARLVKNFALRTKSWVLRLFSKQQPGPFLSERVRRVQLFVNSSIVFQQRKIKERKQWVEKNLFPKKP